jgi:broad specificity phosphatase PhoE
MHGAVRGSNGRRRERVILLCALALAMLGFRSIPATRAAHGLDVYFVRHAETVANATGRYAADTIDRLSTRGTAQLPPLTRTLQQYRFDAIRVSPFRRAMATIAPYLDASGATAEVWPELAECCSERPRTNQPSTDVPRGGRIEIDQPFAKMFRLPEPEARLYRPRSYADGLAQVYDLRDRLVREFGGSGKTILLVGHSLAGTRLIDLLLDREPVGHLPIDNAEVTHLQQRADGSFVLVELNGKRVARRARASGG